MRPREKETFPSTAEIFGVPAGLITRVDGGRIEILPPGRSEGNPSMSGCMTDDPEGRGSPGRWRRNPSPVDAGAGTGPIKARAASGEELPETAPASPLYAARRNVNPSFGSASIVTLSPSRNSPFRIRIASGSCRYFWIARRSGRAPKVGS